LEKNVDKRLSADEALEHPWIVNARESLGSPKKINRLTKEYALMEELKGIVKKLPKIQSSDNLKIIEQKDENI
jgi:hypothetical protein